MPHLGPHHYLSVLKLIFYFCFFFFLVWTLIYVSLHCKPLLVCYQLTKKKEERQRQTKKKRFIMYEYNLVIISISFCLFLTKGFVLAISHHYLSSLLQQLIKWLFDNNLLSILYIYSFHIYWQMFINFNLIEWSNFMLILFWFRVLG